MSMSQSYYVGSKFDTSTRKLVQKVHLSLRRCEVNDSPYAFRVARIVCNLVPMHEKQHALGVEPRKEMLAQGISQVEMIDRAHLKPASFRNWFVTAKNPAPYPAIVAVCDVLGVEISEMSRRAEATTTAVGSPSVDRTLSEHIASQTSPAAQAAIAEGKQQVKRRSAKRQNGR